MAKGQAARHQTDFSVSHLGDAVFESEVLLEAGACVHQPPGIRHVEIAHSDNVEILEITLPAEFGPDAVAAPEAPAVITAGSAAE